MKNKNSILTVKSLLIIIPSLLLAINVIIALANPQYATSVSSKLGKIAKTLSGSHSVFVNDHNPTLAQGGINLQKVGEDTKKKVEGATGGADQAAASAAPGAAAGKGGKAGAKGKKKKKPIPPEIMKKALDYFQTSLLDRDIILIGQTDKVVLGDKTIEKPYVSSSFRDNPFDQVEEVNLRTGLTLNKLPPEPFYPPPGHATVSVSAEDFKKIIETVDLNGIVVIGNNSYALINAGSKNFYRKPGEDFKDKITISIDEVNLDAVLVSDEYGNKGLLELGFRKGFQVQPIEGSLFITNVGQ
jgi:hypothetical protein